MICLASDPGKKSFSAACYHKELEPYILELELNARADEVRLARTGAIAERIVFLDRQLRSIKFRDGF